MILWILKQKLGFYIFLTFIEITGIKDKLDNVCILLYPIVTLN